MDLEKEKPLVSILSLCFNQAAFCIETLNSIYHQTYQNIEVILIDDCSSDNSVELIQDWITEHPDLNIQFIIHEKNKGICKSLNEGLAQLKGKYVSIIACDDLMMRDKLKCQVEILENTSDEYGLIYSDQYIIDENGNHTGTWLKRFDLKVPPQEDVFNILIEKFFIPFQTVLLKKEVFQNIGVFDDELFVEDVDFLFRVTKKYKIVYSDYMSAKYRRHSSNTYNHYVISQAFAISYIKSLEKHIDSEGVKEIAIKNMLSIILKRMANDYKSGKILLKQHKEKYGLTRQLRILTLSFPVFYLFYTIPFNIKKILINLRNKLRKRINE